VQNQHANTPSAFSSYVIIRHSLLITGADVRVDNGDPGQTVSGPGKALCRPRVQISSTPNISTIFQRLETLPSRKGVEFRNSLRVVSFLSHAGGLLFFCSCSQLSRTGAQVWRVRKYYAYLLLWDLGVGDKQYHGGVLAWSGGPRYSAMENLVFGSCDSGSR
jgi:hypothetical protein